MKRKSPRKKRDIKRETRKNEKKVFKKNLYSRKDSSSSSEDDETDSDSEKVLFMAKEYQTSNYDS
jgi:hypothetical protein